MIIDMHVHVWRWPEHWNKEIMLTNQPTRRRTWPDAKWKAMWDLPIETYLEEAEGVIDKAIIVALRSWDTLGVTVPNDYVCEVVRKYPNKLYWACCINPTEKGAVEEVERCWNLGAVAVGELGPAYGNYYVNDPRCYPVWAKCQQLGVPLIIHASPSNPRNLRMKYANLMNLDDVAIDFPELKIVICHCGYYKYEDAAFLMAKHENVYCDISWLASIAALDRRAVPRYLPTVDYAYAYHYVYPMLYYWTQFFGDTDKLLFGSDWSSCSPKASIEALIGINDLLKKLNIPAEVPEQTIQNILHENWRKVFNLDRNL